MKLLSRQDIQDIFVAMHEKGFIVQYPILGDSPGFSIGHNTIPSSNSVMSPSIYTYPIREEEMNEIMMHYVYHQSKEIFSPELVRELLRHVEDVKVSRNVIMYNDTIIKFEEVGNNVVAIVYAGGFFRLDRTLDSYNVQVNNRISLEEAVVAIVEMVAGTRDRGVVAVSGNTIFYDPKTLVSPTRDLIVKLFDVLGIKHVYDNDENVMFLKSEYVHPNVSIHFEQNFVYVVNPQGKPISVDDVEDIFDAVVDATYIEAFIIMDEIIKKLTGRYKFRGLEIIKRTSRFSPKLSFNVYNKTFDIVILKTRHPHHDSYRAILFSPMDEVVVLATFNSKTPNKLVDDLIMHIEGRLM